MDRELVGRASARRRPSPGRRRRSGPRSRRRASRASRRSARRAAPRRSRSRRRAPRPAGARRRRPGAKGSSWISLPATSGTHSSSRPTQRADHARLRLAALAEEDQVVAAEQRVLDRGDHAVVVADGCRGRAARARRSFASRLARISSRSVRRAWPAARSSPRVRAAAALPCGIPAGVRAAGVSRSAHRRGGRRAGQQLDAALDDLEACRRRRCAAPPAAPRRRSAPPRLVDALLGGRVAREERVGGPLAVLLEHQRLEEGHQALGIVARRRQHLDRERVGLALGLAAEGVQVRRERGDAAEQPGGLAPAGRRRPRPPPSPSWRAAS